MLLFLTLFGDRVRSHLIVQLIWKRNLGVRKKMSSLNKKKRAVLSDITDSSESDETLFENSLSICWNLLE